jgi:F0F1-type ATP synthase membrane subunit b/b'
MRLSPFALTAAVLAVLLYLAVGAVGRAVDQRIQEIDRAVACLDSNATDCEERTP